MEARLSVQIRIGALASPRPPELPGQGMGRASQVGRGVAHSHLSLEEGRSTLRSPICTTPLSNHYLPQRRLHASPSLSWGPGCPCGERAFSTPISLLSSPRNMCSEPGPVLGAVTPVPQLSSQLPRRGPSWGRQIRRVGKKSASPETLG